MTEKDKDKTEGQNQSQKQNAVASDKGGQNQQTEQMIPKSGFDQVNEKRKAAEAELNAVAENLKEGVPEDYRDLIPDLPPAQLIQWLRNATRKGLFVRPSAESLDSKRPNNQQTQDLSDLNPMQLMSMGYGKK